jgi:hypothetical protein
MSGQPASEHAMPRGTGGQLRRVAFFFDDYVDTTARILEIGGGDGWLVDYLRNAGFHSYRRLDPRGPTGETRSWWAPTDLVGELSGWRGLGLATDSLDIVIAFDGLPDAAALATCFDLLASGGRLFLVAPRPNRRRLGRLLAGLGLRRPNAADAAPLDVAALGGFRLRKRRRAGLADEWLLLQKPLDSSSGMRVER